MRREPGACSTHEVRGTVSLALSLVETMLGACDAQHIDDPCVQARSVFVDTSGVSPVDFGISEEQQELLLTAGRAAAVGFLQDWDFAGLPAHLPRDRGGTVRVWLPYAEWAEDMPSGVDVDVYDGDGAPPSTIEDVELYVIPT